MNTIRKYGALLLIAVGLMVEEPSAKAASGFDFFGEPTTIVLTTPQQITSTRSNDVIDIHGFQGIGKLDIMISTNSQTGTSTVNVYSSPDRTNWTALTYALGVNYPVVLTNLYYGSATPLATNVCMLPGTPTTPTAATAGFATPYINPAPFTNVGALTITNYTSIGFVVPNAGRYLTIAYTISSQTNSVSAVFTGRPATPGGRLGP